MARVRDLLYRFRPAGAPGAAGATGVPADRAGDLDAELAPVFAALTDTEQACALIVQAGRDDAAAIRARDTRRVAALLADARERTAAVRAGAAAAVEAQAAGDAARQLAAAQARADELRRRAADRIPDVVRGVVAATRALTGAPDRSVPTPAAPAPAPVLPEGAGSPAGTR